MKFYLVRCVRDACFADWRRERWIISPSERVIKAFADPLAANDLLDSLHRIDVLPPKAINPFVPLAMHVFEDRIWPKFTDLSHLSEQDFVAQMGSMELKTPTERASDQRRGIWDWPTWWNRHANAMTEYQQREIRKLLNRIPLFEIIETDLEAD